MMEGCSQRACGLAPGLEVLYRGWYPTVPDQTKIVMIDFRGTRQEYNLPEHEAIDGEIIRCDHLALHQRRCRSAQCHVPPFAGRIGGCILTTA